MREIINIMSIKVCAYNFEGVYGDLLSRAQSYASNAEQGDDNNYIRYTYA